MGRSHTQGAVTELLGSFDLSFNPKHRVYNSTVIQKMRDGNVPQNVISNEVFAIKNDIIVRTSLRAQTHVLTANELAETDVFVEPSG